LDRQVGGLAALENFIHICCGPSVHVPYRGEVNALIGLLGGQVEVIFSTMPGAIEYIRAGKLRPLAVTTATRFPELPEIPTVSEFLPGYETGYWFGVGAPRHTPAEIIEKLNNEINAALTNPGIKARLADFGGIAFPGLPVDFGKFVVEETEKSGKVIRAANIRLE
jgi:tripartite-type tricarboxylate transporter receptor subunit TctC